VAGDRGTWKEVQDRRGMRASAFQWRDQRFYLSRGLGSCKKCGAHMAGSGSGTNNKLRNKTPC